MSWCDIHRNLHQLLLEAGAISETELLEFCQNCIDQHRDAARTAGIRFGNDTVKNSKLLDKMVSMDLSAKLVPLGMKVAKMRFKGDGLVYFGIVNLRDDAIVKHATDLGKPQQEFLHKLVVAINSSDDKSLESIDAQNVRLELSPGVRLSIDDTLTCLQRLEQGQWLTKSDEGAYSLGVRSEMQGLYMRDQHAVES